MELLLLLLMLTSCVAVPQNMAGKMFTFPQQTNTDHVRLTTSRQVLRAATVCLRSFTDISRNYGLFSLATRTIFNDLLIFKNSDDSTFNLYIRNRVAQVKMQDYTLNTWHSICYTWDATSGLAQLWLNGKPSARKFVSAGTNISGPIIMVLGQEQDTFGGGFDATQSFVGMMSDVYMWDYVLSPCEIQHYVDGHFFPPGNVLSWTQLEFQIVGRVLVEESQTVCQ